MNNNIENLVIENAHIIFKNFSGSEGRYNREGRKNFCVIIEDEATANELKRTGWNIKTLSSRNGEEPSTYYLKVDVSYDYFPPKIFIVTKKSKTLLDAESISALDYADIKNVDIVIRPYCWEVNGNTGIKAYVKTMYVVIEEDEFADKYAESEFPDDSELCPFE